MSATLASERDCDVGESDRALTTGQHVRREMRAGLVCYLISRRRSYHRQQERAAQRRARCLTWLRLCGRCVVQGRAMSRASFEYRGSRVEEKEESCRR